MALFNGRAPKLGSQPFSIMKSLAYLVDDIAISKLAGGLKVFEQWFSTFVPSTPYETRFMDQVKVKVNEILAADSLKGILNMSESKKKRTILNLLKKSLSFLCLQNGVCRK